MTKEATEPRFHPDHVDDNLGIPDDAGPYAAARIRRDHASLASKDAIIARLEKELEDCRKAFRDASDSYSRLRWPDTTGQ